MAQGLLNVSPGYMFDPQDSEVILYYLQPKTNNGHALPKNFIYDIINVYNHHPQDLAASFKPQGKNVWYFFSTNQDGSSSSNSKAKKKGTWLSTGGKPIVNQNNQRIGFKRSLVYYELSGSVPSFSKTDWIMHEFSLDVGTSVKAKNLVLCRFYNKIVKANDMDEHTLAPM